MLAAAADPVELGERSHGRRIAMGEERLIKGGAAGRKRTARDDVAVAIAAAVSEGARMPKPPRRRRHYVA